MKSLLLGNGINIQFGGMAYTSRFIIKRIKYNALIGGYDKIFGGEEFKKIIPSILEGFTDTAKNMIHGKYDDIVVDEEEIYALNDFKDRYKNGIEYFHDIMLEDWFLVILMFFCDNKDLEPQKKCIIQGFECMVLDAIYNEEHIQDIYKNMEKNKAVKRFFKSFNNIFTLNYDNNIEKLIGKEVYHLHGDFSVLNNSENKGNILGFIRHNNNSTVYIEDKKHCYCTALLNYSGRLKRKTIEDSHNLIISSEHFVEQFKVNKEFRNDIEKLKMTNIDSYNMLMTKIEHPKLNMATEYHFHTLEEIEGELNIIGMSPNNDGHIFDTILKNKKIDKIKFYYFDEKEREYIEANFNNKIFECEKVENLWESLKSVQVKYNCNHKFPDDLSPFLNIFNAFSEDLISEKELIDNINKIPNFEMIRLSKLVKNNLILSESEKSTISKSEFEKEKDSISYVAVQEGILPSVLFAIYTMNMNRV